MFSGFPSSHTGLSPSAPIQRASSPSAKGLVPARDIRHSWDSDRLNRIYLSAVTQGPAFQYKPFSGSLSGKPQCLVYGPDKTAFSFDRWPDFLHNLPQLWLIFGFLIQEVKSSAPSGSAPVTTYHRDQITLGITLLSIWFCVKLLAGIQHTVLLVGQIQSLYIATGNHHWFSWFYSKASHGQPNVHSLYSYFNVTQYESNISKSIRRKSIFF